MWSLHTACIRSIKTASDYWMLPVLFLIIFVSNVTKAYFGVHILVVICVSLIHSMSYMCKHGSSKWEGERVFHVCARLYVFVFLNSAGSKKNCWKCEISDNCHCCIWMDQEGPLHFVLKMWKNKDTFFVMYWWNVFNDCRLGPMPAKRREREDSGDEDELPTKVIIFSFWVLCNHLCSKNTDILWWPQT